MRVILNGFMKDLAEEHSSFYTRAFAPIHVLARAIAWAALRFNS